MWKILKMEIDYNKVQLTSVVLLPVLFGLFCLTGTLLMEQENFFTKYFWSMFVGLGTYFLIFAVWSRWKKEQRERFQRILPVSSKNISVFRFIFGISPVLLIFVILELIKAAAGEGWYITITRIHAQLGLMFILLATIALLNETISRWSNWFVTLLVALAIFILTYVVIHSVTIEVLPPLTVGGSEVYFYLWGVLLSFTAAVVYNYRKSYLK